MTATRRSASRRRMLAVLAAAGVLGVGASVTTLAAWNEPQAVHGGNGGGAPIGTSVFCVEESLDGVGFASVSTAAGSTGNELPFSPALATALSPADTVYAWVSLATCPSSRSATVSLSAATFPTASALSSLLTYGVRTGVASGSCNATGFATTGTALVPAQTPVLTASPTTFTLPANGISSAGVATSPVGVCFALGLSAAATVAAQGQTGVPVWTFDAVSN